VAQGSLLEIRRYRKLLEEVGVATKVGQLADIADRTDRQITSWVLRESMKYELTAHAAALGVPCLADPESCFDYLLGLARPQVGMFRKNNVSRDQISASLTDWAMASVRGVVREHRTAGRFDTGVETDDGRPLDIAMNVEIFGPHLDVVGRFSGPVDLDAAIQWAGLVELDVRVPERFDEWTTLRSVLARTIRHELEHAHDVGVPGARNVEDQPGIDAFRKYILSPREISAWSAHIANEGDREGLDLRSLLEANGRIVAEGAVRRGATTKEADKLATAVVSAWSRALSERLPF
jgi:hypothetical protein